MHLKRMKDVRRSRGLTQRELASRLRTDQPPLEDLKLRLNVRPGEPKSNSFVIRETGECKFVPLEVAPIGGQLFAHENLERLCKAS
jgi:hypothetical protein